MCSTSFAARLYVTTTGTGNCTSWPNACSLSTALGSAAPGDEIWVKAGTYTGPIYLPNAVKMIGGFAGAETAASQSNPVTNVTIVDGGNSDRAVISEYNSPSTILRGFTIQNGNTSALEGGGGLLVESSGAIFVRCVFTQNRSSMFGGGVAIRGTSSTHFANCKFTSNGTGSGTSVPPMGGGAAFLQNGTATFSNCLFVGNKAAEAGALFVLSGAATLRNCTFVDNQATVGSGGAFFDPAGAGIVRNCIFWGNTAVQGGNQIFNGINGVTSITYSDIQGGWTGTGNINSDPLFINPGSGNYDLPENSPCKDVGNNDDLAADVGDLDWDGSTGEPVPLDLNVEVRVNDIDVDMGAYEGPVGIIE